MARRAYVVPNEVYITIYNIKGHYEFYQGDEFLRSCDIDELEQTKKELSDEYKKDYGKVINFICK